MKHKLTPLILATIAVFSLTGCSGGIVENGKTGTVSGAMYVRHEIADGYSILEERNTGICYLEYDYANKHALTIMLNQDGTPRKWSEMEGQDEIQD